MAVENFPSKTKKEIDEHSWKFALERAADYILRHPSKEITLFILLRSIDDGRFLNLNFQGTKRFLMDLACRVSYKIYGDFENYNLCIIKYNPEGVIKDCKDALCKLIELKGTGDMDAIRKELIKQNYAIEVIEIAINLRVLGIIKKRYSQTRQTT